MTGVESAVVADRMRRLWPRTSQHQLTEAIFAIAPYQLRTALYVLDQLEAMTVRQMPSAELIQGVCDDVEQGAKK